MLGGADIQISAIKEAKRLGYHVITCDYLPNNPGHQFSDEYHNVSTTDKEKVLELAKSLQIDGISAYASDPAALTAAYVSEKLGLPGNSYDSVLQLSDKFRFRKLQHQLGMNAPRILESSSIPDIKQFIASLHSGAIIKPVDTSGSKGVHILQNDISESQIEALITDALSFSRMKRIIVEEYIVRVGSLMSGDALIENGKVLFMCFGDVHFNTQINGLVPRSISLPASAKPTLFDEVKIDLQRLVDALQIRSGVFNLDIIEDQNGKPVIIDIGARNGGNLFNDIIYYHSGVNLIELSMKQCCGEPVTVSYNGEIKGYYAHNVIHSLQKGRLKNVEFSDALKPHIIYQNIVKQAQDEIEVFTNSSLRLGLILLKFDSKEQMLQLLGDIYNHVKVNTI